jgi:UDP-N-acetylmuramate dehydrogenase
VSAYQLGENVSLAGRNTFRISARAEILADVKNSGGLAELFDFAMLRSGPVMILGEGSNILFAADVPGVVICLTMSEITIIRDEGDVALVRADAGVNWNDFIGWTLGRGLLGLENMSLIPGTVGACPIQNIGAYGVEVGEFIETVEVFDRQSQRIKRIDKSECEFAYRDSLFKQDLNRYVICAVEFLLPRTRELKLDYAGVREELASMGIDKPRAAHVAEAISRIRSRKLPNPAMLGNAGSFFKNPMISAAQLEQLRTQNNSLPSYPGDSDNTRKISAAWLIEHAGWKGFRDPHSDAGIAEQHALVLVNHGNATGLQLLDLARRVSKSVYEKFGVHIEPEPRIIGASFNE